MYKRIFRSVCTASLIVFFASILLVFGVVYTQFEDNLEDELALESDYLAATAEKGDYEFLNDPVPDNRRVTIISQDGDVLYDSSADISEMENHLEREEIQEAIKDGVGSSQRYSQTLLEKTVYYTVRMDNGNILRLAAPQDTVWSVMKKSMPFLIGIIVFAVALSAFIASRASKSIVKPLMTYDLNGDNDDSCYDELLPFVERIKNQQKKIDTQSAEAVKKQEEFRLVTENMKEGILVIDEKAHPITWNMSAVSIFDKNSPSSNETVLSWNRSKDFWKMTENVLHGEYSKIELTLKGRECRLIANPVYENGSVIGGVIVILDITEQKEMETMRREFTANVSHELKTPLTSIYGFAQLMESGEVAREDVMDFSHSICEEATRLITLVNDIIKLSELDEGMPAHDRENVNLLDLASETAARLKSTAQSNDITVSVSGDSVSIKGIRKVLDEMIYNLCDNAIKYNRKGGKVDITVTKLNDGKNIAKISVKDNGIGIPEKDRERVFERFYRVDKSHSKEIGGTGLGLSIVKHAAACHNANTELVSTPGKGTVVTVTFPVE